MWPDHKSCFAINVCRLCANSSDVIAPIFGEDDKERIDLKIRKCLPILISEDDSKPKYVCITCISKLEICSQLLDLSLAADSKFDELLQSPSGELELKAEDETINIPIVMADEDNGDGDVETNEENLIILNKITEESVHNQSVDEREIPSDILFMVKVMKYEENDGETSPEKSYTIKQQSPKTYTLSYTTANSECDKTSPQLITITETPASSGNTNTNEFIVVNETEELTTEADDITKHPVLFDHSYDGAAGQTGTAVVLKTSDSHKPIHRIHIKPFSCSICSKTYMRKATLNAHTQAVHTKSRPHLCNTCGASFSLRWDLTLHMRIHNKDFACVFCHKAFSVQNKLERHIRTHTGERPYPCPTCGKAFSDKRNLASHERTHSSERPFVCAFCGKSFRVRAHLTDHRRVHSLLAAYACNECGKQFKWKTNLNIHLKLHAGIRYPCEACGRQFARHTDMVKHAATHDGSRPYTCDICNKSYADRSVCQKHMKSHSDNRPHKCTVCNKGFHFQWYLAAHMKTHATSSKVFECDLCGKVFSKKSNLVLHAKEHETEEWVGEEEDDEELMKKGEEEVEEMEADDVGNVLQGDEEELIKVAEVHERQIYHDEEVETDEAVLGEEEEEVLKQEWCAIKSNVTA